MRRLNLSAFVARNAVSLGQIAAEVPDPLAIGGRMGGDGDPRLRPTAEAVRVQRLQCRALGQHHMQWTQLLLRLLDTQRREQLGITGPGAEHHALRMDLAAVDDQPAQLTVFLQRFDTLGGKQAITGQFGQTCDQARHIEHQLGEAIDLALELRVLQRRRQLLTLDLIDPTAHRLAGKEAGEVAGQGAGRPEIMGVGQDAHTGEVSSPLPASASRQRRGISAIASEAPVSAPCRAYLAPP